MKVRSRLKCRAFHKASRQAGLRFRRDKLRLWLFSRRVQRFCRRGPFGSKDRRTRASGWTRFGENSDAGAPLQLASVIPPPDVLVTAEPAELAIQPGKSVTVTLRVQRQNEFKGRVPCSVENLPPGVRVVNVGLNGVLVTESQTSRTFTLHAEDWAKPITQPIYVVGKVESNSPTMHPSAPIQLEVAATLSSSNQKQAN